jgi:hypothetical protein
MLRALSSLLHAREPVEQLTLDFDARPAPPRDAGELLLRLKAFGLKRIEQCRLTRNRNVMVSYRGAELRVHEGYLAAPPDILRAIVVFVQARSRADRRAAQRRIVSFKIDTPAPAVPRRERTHRDDEPIATKLTEWHAQFNTEYFGGALKAVPVRVSRRMRRRLGHYCAAAPAEGRDGEIAVSLRHLRRHGWEEALHTLLHEMVHQWQDETGLALDHGSRFRAKAREIGIDAAAKRAVSRDVR